MQYYILFFLSLLLDHARWVNPLDFAYTTKTAPAVTTTKTTTTTATTTTTTTTTTTIYYSKSSIDDDDTTIAKTSSVPKIFYLDILECPSLYLNDINTQINTFISNAYYRYNKQVQVNVMFPTTCTSTNCCSKLSSIASGGHSCKTTGIYYYKTTTHKTDQMSGVFCIQGTICSTLIKETKANKYLPFTIYDLGNNKLNNRLVVTSATQSTSTYYISTTSTIFSQHLFCTKHSQLVPLPFYSKANNLHCGCFCPVGYELVKGDCVKKPTEYTQVSQHCNWIKKRFTYRNSQYCLKSPTTSSLTNQQCRVVDLFAKLGFTTLPFPDETYLNFQDNFNDTAIPLTGPRILLNITKFVNANTKVPNWYQPRTFTWKDFQSNRERIFSQYIQIDTVGKYVVTLKAYGYTEIPAICTTVISAFDNFPPRVVNTQIQCPISMAQDANYMSYSSYVNAQAKVHGFNKWVENIVNDEFGENKRVDLYSYKIRPIGSNNYLTTNTAYNSMDISGNEITALVNAIWGYKLTNEKVVINNQFCKKCISLYHEPRELRSYYNFPAIGQTKGTWILDEISSSGTKCNYSECYVPNSLDFFSPSVRISTKYMQLTKTIINTRYSGLLYNNLTDIHLQPSCNDLTSAACQITSVLGEVFNWNAEFSNEYRVLFEKLKANPWSMIRFRYNVNGGLWQEISSTSKITFTQLYNAVIMEAYSACGQIGTQLKFNVYIHPVEKFDICYSMERFSWYQSTTGIPLDGETRICNYPNTDFGEFSFAYNGLTESKTMLASNGYSTTSNFLTFDGISCTIEYVQGNQRLQSIPLISKTNTPLLEHYAVNLIRSPMSNEMTKLFMNCTASYITSEKVTVKGTCSKQLVFHDCNDPGWNCPFGDCLLKCPLNHPRPNQICQGKAISYVGEKTIFDDIKTPKTCCQTCGEAKCQDLTAAEPLGLKQCIANHPITDEKLPAADSDDEEFKLAGVDENDNIIETRASVEGKPLTPELIAQNSNSTFSHLLSLMGLSSLGVVLLLEIHRRRRNARQQEQRVRVDDDDHQLDYHALLNE